MKSGCFVVMLLERLPRCNGPSRWVIACPWTPHATHNFKFRRPNFAQWATCRPLTAHTSQWRSLELWPSAYQVSHAARSGPSSIQPTIDMAPSSDRLRTTVNISIPPFIHLPSLPLSPPSSFSLSTLSCSGIGARLYSSGRMFASVSATATMSTFAPVPTKSCADGPSFSTNVPLSTDSSSIGVSYCSIRGLSRKEFKTLASIIFREVRTPLHNAGQICFASSDDSL